MRIAHAIFSGLTVALASGHAVAQVGQPDEQSVVMSGNVSQLCILGLPDPNTVDLGVLVQTSGLQVGRLAPISNRAVQLPGSFCNYGGTALSVDAVALLAADTALPPSGYSRAVNYTATVTDWAPIPASATTTATTAGTAATASGDGGALNEVKEADLTLILSNFSTPSDAFLVAGDYAGSVTITIGPDLGSP